MRWILLSGVLALLFALLSSEAVLADTTYISDKIPVQVYSGSFESGALVTTLESGAVVEVTQTDGDYSKIRTLDGKEGWVKSNFLSKEKPVRSKYLKLVAKHKELQDEYEQLKEQLKNSADAEKEKAAGVKMRKDLKQAQKTISGLEKQLKEKTAALGDLQKQLNSVKNQPPARPEANMSAAQSDQPAPEPHSQKPHSFDLDYPIAVKWTLATSLLCILLGGYLGYTWLDNKIRRRHGGVRIR